MRAPDLAEVVQQPGPFATVYLTTEADLENAAQLSEQRWKTLRGHMGEAGTPEDVLAAIDPLVGDAHVRGGCLGVVANVSGVIHVEHGPLPPQSDVGRWAPLPSVATMIEWRQFSPPHVVVLADRQGADLFAFRHEAPDVHREAGDVADYPMRKPSPGGWAQRRYQERAENTWEKNADDVANELVRLVSQIDARLVIAAGDVRAMQLLQESLPKETLDILEVIGGGRSVDGSSIDTMSDDIRRLVETAAVADTAAVAEKFEEEIGQDDRAAHGMAQTIDALRMAQVDVLLVVDDPEDERQLWFGAGPTQLGSTREEVEALGEESPTQARSVDVLIRGALGTGAAVRVLPVGSRISEGIGAILRWSS